MTRERIKELTDTACARVVAVDYPMISLAFFFFFFFCSGVEEFACPLSLCRDTPLSLRAIISPLLSYGTVRVVRYLTFSVQSVPRCTIHTSRDGKDESGSSCFRMDHLDPSLAQKQTYHVHPSFILTLGTPPRNARNHVPGTLTQKFQTQA
ncbi:hypothetical protein HOY80DRAFT_80891 [Tuber brumale]|nr:hypothetical protein HOY80DRAFT_80891 [Tuber brumale]